MYCCVVSEVFGDPSSLVSAKEIDWSLYGDCSPIMYGTTKKNKCNELNRRDFC